MYNRYIPQSDGTYRRNRVSEPAREPSRPTLPREEPTSAPRQEDRQREPEAPPCQNCVHGQSQRRQAPPRQKKTEQQTPLGVGSFLRQLLPKDFDTEDLMIVLLLLLMAGDCQEDQNSALLTLALYLFL